MEGRTTSTKLRTAGSERLEELRTRLIHEAVARNKSHSVVSMGWVQGPCFEGLSRAAIELGFLRR